MKSCSKCLPTLLTTVNFTGRNWISKTAYWNIWHKDKRKIQKASIRFWIFVKNYFSFQFHVNLEYYILGSPICVNFIDFNCYCHWFKTAIVSKQVVLHAHYFRSRHATAWRNCLHKFSNLTVNSLVCHHFCYQNWIHTFDIATFFFYDVKCLLVNMTAVKWFSQPSPFLSGNNLSFAINSVQATFGFPEASAL